MNQRPVKSRFWKIGGSAACLLAVLTLLDGHWLVLQSVAWARMLSHYARQESLASAFSKTFDGRHPCALCWGIQQGRQQEQGEGKALPSVRIGETFDLLCDLRQPAVPLPPSTATPAIPVVPGWRPDFSQPPPTPPPRAA